MTGAAAVEALLGAEQTGELAPHPGAPPVPAAYPRRIEEVEELLRLTAREGLVILPIGTGSSLGALPPPEHVDLVVSTAQLSGVVAYEPGDGTLTALAGTEMSTLRDITREGGHWLTPDVARPKSASLGGVIAASRNGVDRLRYGPTRHHVLGTCVVLANGKATRSGGRLVKNVTGYDLHRLYCGSQGALGILVEVSLRLFPFPGATALCSAEYSELNAALEAACAVTRLEARPTWVIVRAPAEARAPFELHVRLDARPEVLEHERGLMNTVLSTPHTLEGEAAREAGDALRDADPCAGAGPALHIACKPSAFAEVAARFLDRTRAAAPALLHPALATLDASLEGIAGDEQARLTRALRAELAPLGVQLRLQGEAAADAPPDRPAGFALMQRLRDTLDPDARFARGRLPAGL